MQFRYWLFSEIQHVNLPEPTSIYGVTMDWMDFRFEDWGKGANPEKGENLIPPVNGHGFMMMGKSFSAPLPGRKFLNVTHSGGEASVDPDMTLDQWKAMKAAGNAPAVSSKAEIAITVDEEAQNEILNNPHWFRFVLGNLSSNLVKEPEWPRSNGEKIAHGGPMQMPLHPSKEDLGFRVVTNNEEEISL